MATDDFPVWSPDGSTILFQSNRDGIGDLHVVAAGGTAQETIFFSSGLMKEPTDWSHDGRFISFGEVIVKTKPDIWILPTTGKKEPFAFLQTEFTEYQGKFSPDGHWFAYASDESGRLEVYVQTFPASGRKWQVSASGGAQPRWRRDERELFYISPDRTLMAVGIKSDSTFTAGVPKALFKTKIDEFRASNRYDVDKDGRRFLMNVPVSATSPAAITVIMNWSGASRKK